VSPVISFQVPDPIITLDAEDAQSACAYFQRKLDEYRASGRPQIAAVLWALEDRVNAMLALIVWLEGEPAARSVNFDAVDSIYWPLRCWADARQPVTENPCGVCGNPTGSPEEVRCLACVDLHYAALDRMADAALESLADMEVPF